MKLDVLPAVHFIALVITTYYYCFVKGGFSVDHPNSNDNRAVKLTGEEENDWHHSKSSL
jgi:hypothetical protein